MNKDKLKQFVDALDALSDDIKDWDVDMDSEERPTCGTPGCHAGLIYMAAEDLPELQDIYERIVLSKWNSCSYRYEVWSNALTVFLGFKNKGGLRLWANDNPKLWGNRFGEGMFVFRLAFTDDTDKQLTHRDIINHWKQVLKKVEEEEVKNDE
ncbi:hypothetical protein [uncultured Gammaproteobacteria bacterium]|nr:hypothetical protein [uncultured Gammaproteobacteria bacterium]